MSYISFKVIAETRYLQTVRICGNHYLLGDWDPNASLQLSTTNTTYPEWIHESKIQIDPTIKLEFKCVIQDGDNFMWEEVPNRRHRCDFRRNFLIITFNKQEMNVRTFQKYEISHEFVQEDLMNVQRLSSCRDYDPFNHDLDSSDNESLPEIVKQVPGVTSISIRQLECDWRDIIKVFKKHITFWIFSVYVDLKTYILITKFNFEMKHLFFWKIKHFLFLFCQSICYRYVNKQYENY